MLQGRLLGRDQDRLGPGQAALAGQVEDDRPRLDPVHRPGDELALAAGELVEGDVALGLAQPLQDDLLGGLGVDPAEGLGVELLGRHQVADLGRRVDRPGLLEGELGQRILDLGDHGPGPERPDLPGLAVDPDLDVLVALGPPVGRLDGILDGPDELLARDLLLRVELQQGGDEVTIHVAPPVTTAAGGTAAEPG